MLFHFMNFQHQSFNPCSSELVAASTGIWRNDVFLAYLQCRSDAALTQAASALVASFVATLRSAFRLQRRHADNTTTSTDSPNGPAHSFLSQLAQVGYLFVWESLLSTVGNEYGMIDDMHVAIKVKHVLLALPLPDVAWCLLEHCHTL